MTNRTADHGRIQFDCKAFLAHPGNGKKSHEVEVGPPPGWANLAAPWIRQESGNLSPQMSADETQIKTFNHKRHKETQSRSGDPVMARDRERAMPCRGFSRMSADQDGNYGIHPRIPGSRIHHASEIASKKGQKPNSKTMRLSVTEKNEFENFSALTKRLLSVPKAEIYGA
jgi:hypothetical protein